MVGWPQTVHDVSAVLHAVASCALGTASPTIWWEKMFQSSRDTGTIVEYTNVPGPNQSGLSWDRGSLHSSGRWEVQFQGIVLEISTH